MEDDYSSDLDENPLLTLLDLHHRAQFLRIQQAQTNPRFTQLLSHKDQELSLVQSALADLQTKHNTDSLLAQRVQTTLQMQIDTKEKELLQTGGQIHTLTEENQRLAVELDRAHSALGDLVTQMQEMERRHARELAETRLKHEQELYILRKLGR